jgi:Methyltransferase domain
VTGDLVSLIDPSLDPLFWPAERLGVASPWWGHVPFGHWVVCSARPRVLVEVGTWDGVSYSSFCQAVARAALDTRCHAIFFDTNHPGDTIGDVAFDDLKRDNKERYGAFSNLIRSNLRDPHVHFPDRSVDLLHIDSLEVHEASLLFDNWKSKLSSRAIVLVHNTNLRGSDTGTWKLWSELCEQFLSFEFLHGNGLGVLVVGDNVPPTIRALCSLGNSSLASDVRNRFAATGDRWLSDSRERQLVEDFSQRIAAAATETERARAEAHEWEIRAKDHARAREQIARHMDAARRDVYDANLLAEQAEDAAARALRRAEQAELALQQAELALQQAELALQQARSELERVIQERDVVLASTIWRATSPLRRAGRHIRPRLAWMFRADAKPLDPT